jgi:predicted nucleic acid-binding protein
MRRVLLDSNALDPLLTHHGAYEALREAVDSDALAIFFTHVTVDEIAAVPDLEKRRHLLILLIDLGGLVLTAGACADFSRANFCRVMGDDDVKPFELLRSGNISHSRDALIAHTALYEKCALVTNEHRLTARARDEGVEVLTTLELLAAVGYAMSAKV